MLSASICSAAAMAGAAYQLRCLLEDWGVARTARLVLTGFFALNPMIVYYGGNGMSEALYVFTILLTCRYLLRWMRRGDLVSLVYAAGSLGVAYLARNEAAGAAILGGVAVVAVSFLRARGSRRNRTLTALTDGVIFLAPVVTSIAGWATASYVITGAWFEQFSSIYGNSSQIRLQPNPVDTGPARLAEALHAIAAFAPLLPVLGVVAIVVCWRRRDLGVVAVLAIVGGGLTFDLGSYYVNSLIWSLRFYILSIPLGILLTAALFAGAPTLPMSRWRTDRYGGAAAQRQPRGTLPGWIALVGLVAMLVPTLFTSGWAMENPTLGSLEQQGLGFVLSSHPNGSDLTYKVLYSHVQAIDGYLAAMHLSNGQILMDDFSSCAPDLIVQSDQPRLFVIPNDRDFERTLAAPLTFHAHYMMVPQPVGQSSLEVIGRTYPNIWANGDGIATLVHNFPAGGACPDFRLYRVLVTPQTTS
jgi:hypothetical protein